MSLSVVTYFALYLPSAFSKILGGRSIGIKTIGESLPGQPKGGRFGIFAAVNHCSGPLRNERNAQLKLHYSCRRRPRPFQKLYFHWTLITCSCIVFSTIKSTIPQRQTNEWCQITCKPGSANYFKYNILTADLSQRRR